VTAPTQIIASHVLMVVNSYILELALIVVLSTTIPTMHQNPTYAINVVRIVKDVLQHPMSLVPHVFQDLNFT
jgi:hypothetical protein